MNFVSDLKTVKDGYGEGVRVHASVRVYMCDCVTDDMPPQRQPVGGVSLTLPPTYEEVVATSSVTSIVNSLIATQQTVLEQLRYLQLCLQNN